MADIVERLRNSAPKMGSAASAQCNDIEAIHLAADEIERLRAERDHWEREAHDHAYDGVDEIERLQAAGRA